MPILKLNLALTVGTFDAAGQSGTAQDVANWLPHKSVQFTGMGGASFTVQGSNDNTNWVSMGDAVTTNSIVALDTSCAFLRVLTNSHTSGTPTAWLAGLRQV
jgi:hypothetical protein